MTRRTGLRQRPQLHRPPGFRLGRDIDSNKAWYFKADILHEFAGNRTFNLTSIDGLERLRFDKTDHDTWYDIGAGITAELSNDRSLWLEFERNFNGSYDNEWELNAGMTLALPIKGAQQRTE